MSECRGGATVAVSWDEGLVLHEGDASWHPWDEAIYGPKPSTDCENGSNIRDGGAVESQRTHDKETDR